MSSRPRLRQILIDAWKAAISRAYAQRRINSERGLQVYFCLEIINRFEKAGVERKLSIEPAVRFSDGERRQPDIVICNRDRIVAVVELKYGPQRIPSPDKDFGTLVRLQDIEAEVELSNDRYRGPYRKKTYSVAKDAVLCWAVVCKETSVPLPAQNAALLGKQLLVLEALAHEDRAPTILWTRK